MWKCGDIKERTRISFKLLHFRCFSTYIRRGFVSRSYCRKMKFAVVLLAALVGADHSRRFGISDMLGGSDSSDSSQRSSSSKTTTSSSKTSSEGSVPYDECSTGILSPLEVLMASFANNADRIKSATDGVACAMAEKLKASTLCDGSKGEIYDCVSMHMERCADMSAEDHQNPYVAALAAIGGIIAEFNKTKQCKEPTRFFSKNFIFNSCIGRTDGCALIPGSVGPGKGSGTLGTGPGYLQRYMGKTTSRGRNGNGDNGNHRGSIKYRRDTYLPKPPAYPSCNTPYAENLKSDLRNMICMFMNGNAMGFKYPPSTACPARPANCEDLCKQYDLKLKLAIDIQNGYAGAVIDCLNNLSKYIKLVKDASLMGLCSQSTSTASASDVSGHRRVVN